MGEKRNSWRESGSDADCLDGHRKNIAYGFEPGAARRMNTENRFYEETAPTLRANMGDNQTAVVLIYDARGNGNGCICPTITGDHQNRITDYTAIVVEENNDSRHLNLR